jgi:TatD DNase family protein
MKLIDTHAHLNFKAYDKDREEVIARTLAQDMAVINVGTQYSTSVRALDLARKYEGLYASVGLHPLHLHRQILEYQDDDELDATEIKTGDETFDYKAYKEIAQDEKTVAIGEIGLDYHHFQEDMGEVEKNNLIEKQKSTFLNAIKLANEVHKPIIVHCWDAYSDLLDILSEDKVEKCGVIHSFVGGYKTANKFIELGYKIGLNGVITYSESFDRLIQEISLDNILLETDCPYLSPVPRKGERNEPAYVVEVAKKIASVRSVTVEEVVNKTTDNAKILFNLE